MSCALLFILFYPDAPVVNPPADTTADTTSVTPVIEPVRQTGRTDLSVKPGNTVGRSIETPDPSQTVRPGDHPTGTVALNTQAGSPNRQNGRTGPSVKPGNTVGRSIETPDPSQTVRPGDHPAGTVTLNTQAEKPNRGPERRTVAAEWDEVSIDLQDRKMVLHFLVPRQPCVWINASDDHVDCNGEALSGPEFVRTKLQSILNSLPADTELVSIGAASERGLPQQETDRAEDRARHVAQWIAEDTKLERKIWLLNMGQFMRTRGANDGRQRPLVLVAVSGPQKSDLTKTVLRSAMRRATRMDARIPDPHHYLHFELFEPLVATASAGARLSAVRRWPSPTSTRVGH